MASRPQLGGFPSLSLSLRLGWGASAIFLSGVLALTFPTTLPAQASPALRDRFAVVIDAAHGGDDSGGSLASPSGQPQPEKVYTLAFNVRLRSLLAARGISVVTTRESDVAIDDQHRAEIANHAQAQACLTIHASSSGNGVHLFLSSLPSAPPARFAPWKTAQAAWVDRSVALAGVLNSALSHAGIKVTLGRTALTTIDSMTCPAVAIEIAPEAKAEGGSTSLEDSGYQARIATAISAGLLQWRTEPHQP
jgi:N-acetylmuramoyl-L-alanine amidase